MEGKNFHRNDFLIFLFFFIVTSIGLLLRNLQNLNEILLLIGGSLGNIGGVVVGSFLFFWWSKESIFKKREIIIFSVGIGFVIYEFLQILIPWQTFDINDIYGTFIGVVLATLINLLIFLIIRLRIEG